MTTRMIRGLVASLCVVATGALFLHMFQGKPEGGNANAAKEEEALRERLRNVERQRDFEKRRADAADADSQLLLSAVTSVSKTGFQSTKTKVDIQQLHARRRVALAALKSGDKATALRDLTLCYEAAISERGAVTLVGLIGNDLLQMGRTYPEALAALIRFRDAARNDALSDPNNHQALAAFANLSSLLNDNESVITAMDSLPVGDKRRDLLAFTAFKDMVRYQRYAEALTGRTIATIVREFEVLQERNHASDTFSDARREQIISNTIMNIEALTGAGRQDEAMFLSRKLLEYDRSPATQDAIQRHVDRALRRDSSKR